MTTSEWLRIADTGLVRVAAAQGLVYEYPCFIGQRKKEQQQEIAAGGPPMETEEE